MARRKGFEPLTPSFYYSGYLAEVFKAGLDAISPGQAEAGTALGNYFVSIPKATPYLAVPEMLGKAFDIASDSFRYAEPLLVVGIIFLALALGITRLVRRMELRLTARTRR